ncbi:MAG: sigma-54-dependent Fis family transcriptional regulator [Deltaproteobacteria bacterium]|nr:sigma-54-dependent Fis family transcriptional regulator [Deltaproteobacteria bacterium]
MPGILLVDDEKDMLTLLYRIIKEDNNFEITMETDPFRALKIFNEKKIDLVITDLKMPGMDGIGLLREVRKIDPHVPVIILTAYATIETAVQAIQEGAYDYLTKPFRRERIILSIDKVMQWQKIVKENQSLKEALAAKKEDDSIIGSTPLMKNIFERIRQVAPTNATVLITGASGTGKELVAKAIHSNSMRSRKKIITVNCTAIPEQVIESELFGHVKGAFTGAWKDKVGLVAEADQGTLFLDEIGDLSSQTQTKLLRLLQSGEYKPVGNNITKKADIRFIAATNHVLKKDIDKRLFREDLYYRLNVFNIHLPTLSERKEDIPLLGYYFLKRYNDKNGKDIKSISESAIKALCAYDFPGNVRELENMIERGVILCRSDKLVLKDLFQDEEKIDCYRDTGDDLSSYSFHDAKEKILRIFHRQYVRAVLKESGGNISRAADIAGIKRQYLHRLMKDTGVDVNEFKNGTEFIE